MSPEERLRQLQIELPPPATPLARYVPAVLTGNLLFISGQLPLRDGTLLARGRLGGEVSVEEGAQAARAAAINALAVARSALGSLDRIARIVRLVGHVAATPEFTDHPRVVDGASELLAEVFGERGKHARVALGAVSLPLGAPVELELIVETGYPEPETRN
ncbi:MAG: RidA family protein [Chloroflexi bacterium]|nr:RidA family protein [Chloroflexota bacterium]